MNWVMERLIPISVFAAVTALLCMAGWINAVGHRASANRRFAGA